MAQRYLVANGPEKMDISASLLCSTSENPILVKFKVENDFGDGCADVEVVITNIGRESGDGTSFNFEGEIFGQLKKVKGFFSTRARKGWMEVVGTF